MSRNDDLAQVIADQLNKSNKEIGRIAFFLGREDEVESPTDVTDWISTGSSLLDLAISNRPHGGIAVGRISELQGLEGSGKSLIAAHIMANALKRDGVAVLIDTEAAVNKEWFDAIGVDTKNMLWVDGTTVEQIFASIEAMVETVRKSDKDKLVVIVVDSLSGAPTDVEVAADYGKDGYSTGKAIIISKALRKLTGMIARQKIALVFTSQLRQKLGAMPFSDPWVTSGGKSLGFHASTRVRLSQAGSIKKKDDNNSIVGINCKAKVTKSRLGPPLRTAEFEIFFDKGIDDTSSWLRFLVERGIIKQTGSHYTITDDGVEHRIQSKEWKAFLAADADRKERLYTQLCDAFVMTYKSSTDPDDMESDDEVDEVEEAPTKKKNGKKNGK